MATIDTHIKRYYSYTSGGSLHHSGGLPYYSGGTKVTTTMYEAQRSSRGPYSFRRWWTCHICAFDYAEDQVVLHNGAAYCIPRRHYTEIDRKRRKT